MPASAPPVVIKKSRRDSSKALALPLLAINDLLPSNPCGHLRSAQDRSEPLEENQVPAETPPPILRGAEITPRHAYLLLFLSSKHAVPPTRSLPQKVKGTGITRLYRRCADRRPRRIAPRKTPAGSPATP